MSEQPPEVMIRCPHLVTVQIGAQVSCSMCGSAWMVTISQAEKDAAAAAWDRRVERALKYQQVPWWKRWLQIFDLRDLLD